MSDKLKCKYLYDSKDDLYLSYVKICGRKIKDIVGYISCEYDEPTFKISKIILEDGYEQYVEGEHDFPYMTDYDDKTCDIIDKLNQEKESKDE